MINIGEVQIAKQKRLLKAKTEELRAVKQRMEEGWALAKQLSACPAPTEEPRQREPALLVELRQELARKDGEISVAQGRLRQVEDDAIARERSFSERVSKLEQQLALGKEQVESSFVNEFQSLRVEPQARNEQLVVLEQHLAAAEAREQQSRG
jgi:hypothetical protein